MSRIDIIGQNGNNGEIYLVETVARFICTVKNIDPDLILENKEMWRYEIIPAMYLINLVQKWGIDKNE